MRDETRVRNVSCTIYDDMADDWWMPLDAIGGDWRIVGGRLADASGRCSIDNARGNVSEEVVMVMVKR